MEITRDEGEKGGPGEADRGGRQRGQKGSGRSIACKTDRDRGKVIKRTVAVDDAPSALALEVEWRRTCNISRHFQ